MAYVTAPQKDAYEKHEKEFGRASSVKLESTREDYGLLIAIWGSAKRLRVYNPDGSLVRFETLSGWLSHV